MNSIKNYILMFFTFVFGASYFFSGDRYKWLAFAIVLILGFMFGQRRIKNELLFLLAYISFLFILQSYYSFGVVEKLSTFIAFLTFVIIVPYILIDKFKISFVTYYVNTIYFLSITSLIFLLLVSISPNMYGFFKELAGRLGTDPVSNENFIIYSGRYYHYFMGFIRNPGPTWEPGAWATFLNLALVFNLMIEEKLWTTKNILFIINILSTFSTAGYISLFIILLYFALSSKSDPIFKFIYVIIFLYGSYQAFVGFDFMQEKIVEHVQTNTQKNIYSYETGRLFALRKALVTMQEYPIVGRGILQSTTASESEFAEAGGQGYGIISIATRYGIPAFLLYLFFFYKSLARVNAYFNKRDKYFLIFVFISIIINQLAQGVYQTPIFMMLFLIAPLNVLYGFRNDAVKNYGKVKNLVANRTELRR